MPDKPDVRLELIIRRAESLVQSAAAFTFALADWGIDLPPVIDVGAVDQAQLRAIATLYLASELDAAGIIPAGEKLSGLARSGSLNLNLGDAAVLIQEFWQSRNERATLEERLSFYSGLFGSAEGPHQSERPQNNEFEEHLLDLCEALYKLDEAANNVSWGGVAQQARVRGAAQRLIANLVRIASGITVFLAQEILSAERKALAILGHPDVKSAFRAKSPLEVAAAINGEAKSTSAINELHIQRGKAGMMLLAWLAEAAPLLDSNKPIVGLDHPVIPAAFEWLETSLALSENVTAPSSTKPSSSWTALAG